MGIKIFEKKDAIRETAVALGSFDGVHIGHAKIISECVRYADENSLLPTVFSFKENPENVLKVALAKRSIVTLSDKAHILGEMGVKALYLADFGEIKDMSPERFCEDIIVSALGAKAVFCGFNFTFGKDRKGNADALSEILSRYGVKVFVSEKTTLGDVTVSSTVIRKLIKEGKPDEAKRFLGRPFFIDFPVERGKRIGTKIGFPTVNQSFPEEYVIPKAGVYAVRVYVGENEYPGVCNIAEKEKGALAETHLFGFSGDLYGKNIKIDFEKYIREEKNFGSLSEMAKTVKEDIEKVKIFFKN